jgi:hypothetical protein
MRIRSRAKESRAEGLREAQNVKTRAQGREVCQARPRAKRDRLRGSKVDKAVAKRETKPRADTRLGRGQTRPKGASNR